MNRLIIAVAVSVPLIITGCGSVRTLDVDTVVYTPTVKRVVYTPTYNADYVSVGYYSTTPYWGNNYWLYDEMPDGYWAGYYNGY